MPTELREESLSDKITNYTIGTIAVGALLFSAFYGTYYYGYTKGKIAKKQEIISKLRDELYILALNQNYYENASKQDNLIVKLDSLEKVVISLQSMDN